MLKVNINIIPWRALELQVKRKRKDGSDWDDFCQLLIVLRIQEIHGLGQKMKKWRMTLHSLTHHVVEIMTKENI